MWPSAKNRNIMHDRDVVASCVSSLALQVRQRVAPKITHHAKKKLLPIGEVVELVRAKVYSFLVLVDISPCLAGGADWGQPVCWRVVDVDDWL
jgi:hypothetical protein